MRFEASVPSGYAGARGLSHVERPQRSQPPTAAPMPTAANCANIPRFYPPSGARLADELVDERRAQPARGPMLAAHVDLGPDVLVARLPALGVDVNHRAGDVEERDHLGAIGGNRQRVDLA